MGRQQIVNSAWATCAIGLGVWETTAITTKRIPTISKTCSVARKRHRHKVEFVVIAWLFGLGSHLLKHVD